jgi:hypothetical protein
MRAIHAHGGIVAFLGIYCKGGGGKFAKGESPFNFGFSGDIL